MAKRNTIPTRIDKELRDIMKDMASKNDITVSEASKDIARTIKQLKKNKQKYSKEIKF